MEGVVEREGPGEGSEEVGEGFSIFFTPPGGTYLIVSSVVT